MSSRKQSYGITIRIAHPDMNPHEITKNLGLEPFRFEVAGEHTFTPKGTKLGKAKNTRWNHVNRIVNGEPFFVVIEKMVDKLIKHQAFFNKIHSEGGRIEIIVNLPGNLNQGSCLAPNVLEKLSKMSMSLGVEVFPDQSGEN